MTLQTMLQANPAVFLTVIGILGLMIGSFLNVVIYRLPLMMEQQWRQDCHEFLGIESKESSVKPAEPFNLAFPASHCPHCKKTIQAWENIPVLSYLLLKGRCSGCKASISARYPVVEAITGVLSVIVAWHFGFTIQTLWALVLTWSLITLTMIDYDHQLLPDSITLPMLWLGLGLSLVAVFINSQASIIGAIAGYMSLWTVYQLFKLVTGKEGMGFGDFKLLAMLGAWLGWQMLPVIVLLSSLVGAVVGITMIILIKHDRNKPIPFGPYLAAAGWLAMIWGEKINQYYLAWIGLQ